MEGTKAEEACRNFDKKIALLDSKIEKQMREAQRYAKTGNKRAMNALKRKKMKSRGKTNLTKSLTWSKCKTAWSRRHSTVRPSALLRRRAMQCSK